MTKRVAQPVVVDVRPDSAAAARCACRSRPAPPRTGGADDGQRHLVTGHGIVGLRLERADRLGGAHDGAQNCRRPKRHDEQIGADQVAIHAFVDRTPIAEHLLQIVEHLHDRVRVRRRVAATAPTAHVRRSNRSSRSAGHHRLPAPCRCRGSRPAGAAHVGGRQPSRAARSASVTAPWRLASRVPSGASTSGTWRVLAGSAGRAAVAG